MPKDRLKPLFSVLASDDAGKIRQAAQRALREIKGDQDILARDAKIIRDLLSRYGNSVEKPADRGMKIREAALALVDSGRVSFSPQDVIDYLREEQGITFNVGKPASVAGTVLNQMPEFRRTEPNRFEFVGNGEEPS